MHSLNYIYSPAVLFYCNFDYLNVDKVNLGIKVCYLLKYSPQVSFYKFLIKFSMNLKFGQWVKINFS